MVKRSKASQFFIAFFMGIFILALPFSYALFKLEAGRGEQEQVEKYYPQVSDSITLTTALKNESDDEPMCFIMAKIDPFANLVSFAVLPPETLVEDAGGFHLAAEVWDEEGARRGAQALHSAAGITGGKWLELDSEAVVKLGETAGAIDFTLPEEITLGQGLMVLSAERQLIDGTKAALIINYDDYSGGERQRLDVIGDLLSQTLIQRAPIFDDAVLVRLFETAVNNGYSDLTVGDFEARRRAFNHMFKNDFAVEEIEISGEYSGEDNAFLLSAASIDKLTEAFSGGSVA